MHICRRRVLSLVMGLVFSQTAFSEVEFRSAKFRNFDKIHEKIAFPRNGGDVNTVFQCGIHLPLSGRIEGVYCDTNEKGEYTWLFERAIYRALKNTRMDRAMFDGKARTVWLHFMVTFIRKGDEKTIEINLSHPGKLEQFGMDYIEAQRLVPLHQIINMKHCKHDTNILIKTVVDVSGKPSNIEITGDTGTNKCKSSLLEQYERSLFIPAHIKGEPIVALFYESITGKFWPSKNKHLGKGRHRPILTNDIRFRFD